MENSEIDVSKCKHYKYDGIKKPLCRSGGCTGVYKSCLCVENTDCYYKQLQQLKAENEELKKQLQEESDLGHKAVDGNILSPTTAPASFTGSGN